MQDSEEVEQDDDLMLHNIPRPLYADAYTLIPCSEWRTCTCCVLYDGHPRDDKKIEITICLLGGKVVELYQREPVSSIEISNVSKFNEIRILRNNKGELFYLVATDDQVIILSSKDKLKLHRSFSNVINYDVCDPDCSGEPKLMISTRLSTTYVSFANDFKSSSQDINTSEESTPVINDLAKKLTEAKYNLRCNEDALKQIETLRQHASFLCKENVELKTTKPIITFCNKNIVILLDIENPYEESLDNVCVLVHNNSCDSISYTSKVYQHLATSPFYREVDYKEIKRKCKAWIAAVIPIKEFENSVSSRIDFSIVVSYERLGKEYLKSFDSVNISACDVMGKNFDVFYSVDLDEHMMYLAMLSTTNKTILCFKQKGLEGDIVTNPLRIFYKYLGMESLKDLTKVAVHKHSPHHILHGIMIIFDEDHNYIDVVQNEFSFNIEVYARSPSQVRALIHFVYDKVPLTLVVTTPNIKLSSHEDENYTNNRSLKLDNTQCADSVLRQSSMTLKYLDDCLKEMHKDPKKLNKPHIQIDLFAMGPEKFAKFRRSMLEEAEVCIEHFVKLKEQVCDLEDVDACSVGSNLQCDTEVMDID